MKKLFLLIFLTSCTSINSNKISENKNFDFNDNLTFNEFGQLLTDYVKHSSHPNIDE